MTAGYKKAQIRQLSQVMVAMELKPLVGPMVIFGPEDMHPLQAQQNDPLLVQLKIATAIVQRILEDIGSSVNIFTLECFKKLQYKKAQIWQLRSLS